jgi:hypothetical protein
MSWAAILAAAALCGSLAAQEAGQKPAPGGQRAIVGAVNSVDGAAQALTVNDAQGSHLLLTGPYTDIHLMRPGVETDLTTGGYALVTGVFSEDGASIQARNMTVYYAKGHMSDYVSARQIRGTFSRDGDALEVVANGRRVTVRKPQPMPLLFGDRGRFEDIRVGDQVETWTQSGPDGVKALLVFVRRY